MLKRPLPTELGRAPKTVVAGPQLLVARVRSTELALDCLNWVLQGPGMETLGATCSGFGPAVERKPAGTLFPAIIRQLAIKSDPPSSDSNPSGEETPC